MSARIVIEPMTAEAFAPYGDLLDCAGDPDKIINQGLCGRYHDRAQVEVIDGRVGISLFHAELRRLPLILEMMERHPEGSQAFVPMDAAPFLVIVAQDAGNAPSTPRAFVTTAHQAINFHRNTWHGVLTPLTGSGTFAVIDRIGEGANLEEHWFDTPWEVIAP